MAECLVLSPNAERYIRPKLIGGYSGSNGSPWMFQER
jgi:hypothetical protein